MAVNNIPVFLALPKSGHVQILPADTSSLKTAYTGGTNGSKIIGILVSSTDTSARDLQVGITASAVTYPLGTKTIAITAGTVAGTPAVNMLDPAVIVGLPVDNDGDPFIFLASGETLDLHTLTTVTAAKAINITVLAEDF